MPSASIRLLHPADIPGAVAASRAADTMFAEAGLDLPEDDPREMLAHVETVLVAGTPVCGLAALTTLDGAAHLEQLAVHPDHGRRGVGSALLEAACAHARGAGRSAMTLTTFRDLPWNGPWYAERGFTELAPRDWGPQLAAQWRAEAGIRAAPRIAMLRPLGGS
ncbi:GNAT superfamily N-acetyltransferase [Nocardiopsis mwathae]|uniref:GNAT superfamily N-acetyltransferase n=1 Tax=Nocardiopsis mwathae TaxID=1472723 RepID=A0A7W9YEU7_9ACTN|nr:GNAT family N-acetyltransferase [Nocardiopsis mwathae]MBB6170787.1 GNAT superfamily N-acetyltransferase [Nocardiopsis mwathae]